MSKAHRSGMFWVVWGVVVALGVLHQDLWFWGDRTLVFGVVPMGLFYHSLFSLACAGTWMMMVKFCWPHHIEEWADEFENQGGGGGAS